jgi:hypothetical protein
MCVFNVGVIVVALIVWLSTGWGWPLKRASASLGSMVTKAPIDKSSAAASCANKHSMFGTCRSNVLRATLNHARKSGRAMISVADPV